MAGTAPGSAAGLMPPQDFPCTDWPSSRTLSTISVVKGQTVNITFPNLPTDLTPPFNISQSMEALSFDSVSKGYDSISNCGQVNGYPAQINTTSFNFTFDTLPLLGYTKNSSGSRVNITAQNFVFVIQAADYNRHNGNADMSVGQPYWYSANYTVQSSTSGTVSAVGHRLVGIRILLLFALILGACI